MFCYQTNNLFKILFLCFFLLEINDKMSTILWFIITEWQVWQIFSPFLIFLQFISVAFGKYSGNICHTARGCHETASLSLAPWNYNRNKENSLLYAFLSV